MSITVRQWAVLAILIASVMLLSGGVFPASTYTKSAASPPANIVLPKLTSGTLPEFPDNLTHFIFIVRENHVFDDYLGDCALDINVSCDDGSGWTSPTSGSSAKETSASGDQLLTPYLHDMARDYAVFDNYYSSVDPYSAQAHAFMFSEQSTDSSDSCVTAGDQGTGTGTAWGIYNNSNVKSGSCGSSSDSGSQSYPTDGTVFDRYLGANVAQSKTTIPFLVDGDIIWELASPGCTSKVPTITGIPGSLPGDSQAVEHVTGCTNGWWTNSSTGSATMPPAVNSHTGAPQLLFACEYACTAPPQPNNDQDEAYSFMSYVADYGLPTYTFIELFDDHPGADCSAAVESTCIQWNDASTNLIVEDIMNSTSPYNSNTVIAITEDDTQDGQNGVDHINDGRRLPLVVVAPHSVEKQGAATGTSCGISTSYHCGYVVHKTFNTSNINAVMERVEMNVNPSVFVTGSPSGNKAVFPMMENDYLAEGDPFEPLWKCGPSDDYCNTGVTAQTLTSTSISPSPISAATSSAVAVAATALDQNGAPISSATYSWALTPSSLGTLTSATGSTVTFNAGASAGNGHLCENATYNSKTMGTCALVSVSAAVSLSSVAIAPTGPISLSPGTYVHLAASALGSNGQTLTKSTTFSWKLSSTLASMNTSTGIWVNLTAGSTTGSLNVCLNGTYSSVTKMSCDGLSISLAPPTLSFVTLVPSSLTVGTGGTQTFYAQAQDQYHNSYNTNVTYQWTLSTSTLGSLSSSSGSANYTVFTAGSTGVSGKLTVSAHSGAPLATNSSSITVTTTTSTLTSVSVSPTSATLSHSATATFTATPMCTSTCPSGTTYSWTLTRSTLGTLSATTGAAVTFTAGTKNGKIGLFVNATLNGVTKQSSVVVIAVKSTLTSVSVSPTSASLAHGGTKKFTATPTCTSSCPTGTTYSWTLTRSTLGKLSATTGASVTFTAGSTNGKVGLFVNATLNGVKKQSSVVAITIKSTTSVSASQTFVCVPPVGVKTPTLIPAFAVTYPRPCSTGAGGPSAGLPRDWVGYRLDT